MKSFVLLLTVWAALLLGACQPSQSGSVKDSLFIPNDVAALSAAELPLRTAGSAAPRLTSAEMLGGLPLHMWLAVYAAPNAQSLAIVAYSALPENWHWAGNGMPPFTVNEGTALVAGQPFRAGTYIQNGERDAFAPLAAANAAEVRWLVRRFVRFNSHDKEKLTLEYRERISAQGNSAAVFDTQSLSAVNAFEQRAVLAFAAEAVPSAAFTTQSTLEGLALRYLDDRFLGEAVPPSLPWND